MQSLQRNQKRRILQMIREFFQVVIDSLTNNPEEWERGSHTLDRGGVQVWHSNGERFCSIYRPTTNVDPTDEERLALWNAVKGILEGTNEQWLKHCTDKVKSKFKSPKSRSWFSR